MKRSAVVLGLCMFAPLACSSGPPVKTASGEVIEGVSYEERLPGATEGPGVTFTGDRLRKAVELMDRAGVIGMTGNYNGPGPDHGTLVVSIHAAENRNRTIIVKNCAEQNVCSFFAAAVNSGVVEKAPAVCRDSVRCIEE